jgi:Flp pilus assembly protein TadG
VSNRRPLLKLRLGRRFAADENGAAAVELAMLLPLFCAFVFGFFEFCWAQHCASSVRLALEQAGRAMIITPTLTQTQVQTMVQNQLSSIADANVTVTVSKTTQTYGELATLTATYPHTIGVPGLANFNITYTTTVKTPLPQF